MKDLRGMAVSVGKSSEMLMLGCCILVFTILMVCCLLISLWLQKRFLSVYYENLQEPQVGNFDSEFVFVQDDELAGNGEMSVDFDIAKDGAADEMNMNLVNNVKARVTTAAKDETADEMNMNPVQDVEAQATTAAENDAEPSVFQETPNSSTSELASRDVNNNKVNSATSKELVTGDASFCGLNTTKETDANTEKVMNVVDSLLVALKQNMNLEEKDMLQGANEPPTRKLSPFAIEYNEKWKEYYNKIIEFIDLCVKQYNKDGDGKALLKKIEMVKSYFADNMYQSKV